MPWVGRYVKVDKDRSWSVFGRASLSIVSGITARTDKAQDLAFLTLIGFP